MKKGSISLGDKRSTQSLEFKGFINYSLTEREKGEANIWIGQNDILNLLSGMIDLGYAVKVSGDRTPGRYIASLSQKEGINEGYILTARAGSIEIALARVVYLHVVVFNSQDWADRMGDADLW